jgi:hypothetical protein
MKGERKVDKIGKEKEEERKARRKGRVGEKKKS